MDVKTKVGYLVAYDGDKHMYLKQFDMYTEFRYENSEQDIYRKQ